MKRSLIVEICSVLLIVLFTYTALSKLLDYDQFVKQLGMQAFSKSYAPAVAYLLPATEIMVSVMLIFPNYRATGLFISVFMMTAFTLYVLLALTHMLKDVPCSCGGVLSKMGWEIHFYFNLCFLLIALLGWILTFRERRSGKLSA